MNDPVVDELLEALRCLPGVGSRTAQRMALHLLERDRRGGERLSDAIARAMREIGRCSHCRNFTSRERCEICESPRRSDHTICVVETPGDVLAIEQATGFDGRYFVLLGRLSPLDGIGPADLGLDQLEKRFGDEPIEEVIVATNSTVEGEATAHYIQSLAARHGIRLTRLAQGVPLGGELEHTDRTTLAHAFATRLPVGD
jgi:recombination protein RecR